MSPALGWLQPPGLYKTIWGEKPVLRCPLPALETAPLPAAGLRFALPELALAPRRSGAAVGCLSWSSSCPSSLRAVVWPQAWGRGAAPEQRVLAACLLLRGSAGPTGSGTGAAAATVAPAASNVCGVKSIPKAARTRADPGSQLWDRWCAGGLHPSRLGLQTTRICSCWDMSPFSGGCWVWPWGWVRGRIPGCPSYAHSLLVQGGRPFPAWRKKSIFWQTCWPGKRLLAPTRCGMASPGVSAGSPAPTALCSGAGDPVAPRPCTPGWFALQSCPGAALLTALPSPTATPVPTGGRQRVASGLREGLLQREAAATLPTSTTTAVQKYPVEASPIPSNDDMVLGETPGTGGSWEGVSRPGWGSVGWWHRAAGLTHCPSVSPSTSAGLIVVCTVAGISALIVAAVCWCR